MNRLLRLVLTVAGDEPVAAAAAVFAVAVIATGAAFGIHLDPERVAALGGLAAAGLALVRAVRGAVEPVAKQSRRRARRKLA